jgi:hypothetical protein
MKKRKTRTAAAGPNGQSRPSAVAWLPAWASAGEPGAGSQDPDCHAGLRHQPPKTELNALTYASVFPAGPLSRIFRASSGWL